MTNRRLAYPFLFFFLSLPLVGMMLSAGDLQNPAAAAPGAILKMLGFFLLYLLLALFAWPFAYGGVIGELAQAGEGKTNWEVFKTWAVKSYGRLLLFNLLIFVLAAAIFFVFAMVAALGFLAAGLSSGGDLSGLEEKLSQPQATTGMATFFTQLFSTVFGEAAVLILVAAMIAVVLTERGLWRSLWTGIKTFFSGPAFKLFLLAFLVFLFLNLLGALVFNRPGIPHLFSGVYFVVLVLLQAYFSALAIAYLLPAFKPKEETEIPFAPTG